MLALSDEWKARYPQANVGLLVMNGVANVERHQGLEARAAELAQDLQTRFRGADRNVVKALPAIQAYNDHYRRFKKTYHVQLQLESVALKGKPIPAMPGLVKAMVLAELRNQLLTAGHDVDLLNGSLTAGVARGDERYVMLGGGEGNLKADDMYIADRTGAISSVLYGPDDRTRLRAETRRVCYTVYGVPGIAASAVETHLGDIRDVVLFFAPGGQVELLQVYSAT